MYSENVVTIRHAVGLIKLEDGTHTCSLRKVRC